MVVSDLDFVRHPASISGGLIVVRHFFYTPAEFVMSGIVLVDYSREEEAELVSLGILTERVMPPARTPSAPSLGQGSSSAQT